MRRRDAGIPADFQMTDAELALVRSQTKLPATVRRCLPREAGDIGMATAAFRKAASFNNAQADLIESQQRLENIAGEYTKVEELRETVKGKDHEINTLRHEITLLREQVAKVTAEGAMAISAEGSQR